MVTKIAVNNMRWMLGIIFMIAPVVANATVSATVDYIFDGDTFAARVHVAPDIEISTRIRIRNIDTPEIHGACDYEIDLANQASNRLSELIPVGSTVTLYKIKDDKYLGRIDANVFDVGGNDVGDVLISEKLARPYDGGKRAPWCE